jgi:hypothetical protein
VFFATVHSCQCITPRQPLNRLGGFRVSTGSTYYRFRGFAKKIAATSRTGQSGGSNHLTEIYSNLSVPAYHTPNSYKVITFIFWAKVIRQNIKKLVLYYIWLYQKKNVYL